jgi:hypothetical protein
MSSSASNYKKKVRDALKEREHIAILKHKYNTRITNVKFGKRAFSEGDFLTAIKRYTEYLEVVSEIKKVPSIYELHPGNFDHAKDITEMLMISNLYFELAKVYDATGKFQLELSKCLDQFVLFSINQPFQVVNSEMCRKHLRKFKFKNNDPFFKAYQQIFVKSRKCYVATHCFGEDHPHTETLRKFRGVLIQNYCGHAFIRSYYLYSPGFVRWLDSHPLCARILNLPLRLGLSWFSRLVHRHILSR